LSRKGENFGAFKELVKKPGKKHLRSVFKKAPVGGMREERLYVQGGGMLRL